MNEVMRPDPDALLTLIKEEEKKAQRGRLKIFFGSSAGVGKTYAMLKAAHEQLEQGKVVLVGLVETHGRPETDALLEGLMLLQPLEVHYRGMQLKEFDLDAALTRNPDIILVDELAHTNAPGMRHPKRWNDVEELLAAGIDVYTALNVQHIESLSDLVAGTTGVWVKETVPDRVFDTADDIVLVDLDEDDLIQRLREGKVYVAPGAMARASENFFRKQNLSALRELALRRTADRVGAERTADIAGMSDRLPLAEKILVCIDADPMSAKLVRSAKRLATGLRAPWIAATVETATTTSIDQDRHRLMAALERMIERMNGRLVTLQGESIVDEVLAFARKERVTKIILGRHRRSKTLPFLEDNIVNKIIKKSGNIDVYVVTDDAERKVSSHTKSSLFSNFRALDYLLALLVVVFLSIPGLMLPEIITATDQALLYLTGIVVIAASVGFGPSLFYALLSACALQIFFVSKYEDLLFQNRPVLFTFIITLVTGYVVASQSARLRNQAVAARLKEGLSRSLFDVTRRLASTRGRFPVSEIVAQHINDTLNCDVTVWMTNEEGHPAVVLGNLPEETYHKDFGALQWCFENAQNAGRGTETMPSAAGLYFPLISANGTLGVMGLYPKESNSDFDKQEISNIEILASLLASALERVRAGEILRQAMIEKESEKLRASFINAAASHFSTPESLSPHTNAPAQPTTIDPATLELITRGLGAEAFKLGKSVRRFMNSTTDELSALQLNRRPTALSDRVRRVVDRLKEQLAAYRVQNAVPDTLPDILIDLSMCEQAIASYLLFLAQTSPLGGRITLAAQRKNSAVVLLMIQERSTLKGGVQQRFFDRLTAISEDDPVPEIPADLGVAASLIRLHGGETEAHNDTDGSVTISVSFPIA